MQKNTSFHLKDGECIVLPSDTSCPVVSSHAQHNNVRPLLPDLDTFVRPKFPLTVELLMDLCTRCWHPCQTRPLSQETGEEAFFGFFHRQRLHTECQILLTRPIVIMDRWEIQRAMETFAANPQVFWCRSIYLALFYCEEYMRKLFGGDTLTELAETPKPTAFEEALEFHEKHALPQHRRPEE